MKNKISIKQYLENFAEGKYIYPDVNTQIDAGWFDWFCESRELKTKTFKLTEFLKQIVSSKKIDTEKMYVWFKNNCPWSGDLYDDFRIADIETGETLYTITPWNGHKNQKGISSVWGKENDWKEPLAEGTWRDVVLFFTGRSEETPKEKSAEPSEKVENVLERPKLQIIGHDGNAFSILGKAMRVAKQHKMDWEKIKTEATSGDYDDLLAVMMKYFDVC